MCEFLIYKCKRTTKAIPYQFLVFKEKNTKAVYFAYSKKNAITITSDAYLRVDGMVEYIIQKRALTLYQVAALFCVFLNSFYFLYFEKK